MSIKKGSTAEGLALEYLLQRGLRLKESNFRTKMGEIDLIMEKENVLIFVEVRARTSMMFGGALESITYTKQQKIIKTAHFYLQRKGLTDRVASRFDVMCIQGRPPTIQWIENAFGWC